MAKKGNTSAQKHGGAAAEKALTSGADFHGPAIVAQVDVHDAYGQIGAEGMIQRAAERLETCAVLYFDAVLAASQQGASVAVLDGYIARFGWLQSKAASVWAEVKKQNKQNNGKLAEVLNAYEQSGE